MKTQAHHALQQIQEAAARHDPRIDLKALPKLRLAVRAATTLAFSRHLHEARLADVGNADDPVCIDVSVSSAPIATSLGPVNGRSIEATDPTLRMAIQHIAAELRDLGYHTSVGKTVDPGSSRPTAFVLNAFASSVDVPAVRSS